MTTATKNEKILRFEAAVDGGVAFLRYRIEGDTMHLLYVEVPPESRGRSIAGELTRHVLRFAEQSGLKVIPVCSYVSSYLARHPEYSGLIAK